MSSERPTMSWLQLHPVAPVALDNVHAALTALATMPGQPRVVLEASGRAGAVSWRIGGETTAVTRALRAIEAHLDGLRTQDSPADVFTPAFVANSVRLAGSRRYPLKHEAIEPTTRSVLSALSQAGTGESVHLQVILGRRSRPRGLPDVEPHLRRVVKIKLDEHRFECEIRIAASAATPLRGRALVSAVAAALRSVEAPGITLQLRRTAATTFNDIRSPWLWPNVLSISDLVPFTAWPIGELPLPGVPSMHPRRLAASPAIPQKGRILGLASGHDGRRPIALKIDDSLRHLHLLGPTGVGKSTVMGNLALADMAAGRGVVVIDPKGDLVRDLLIRIPAARRDDVVMVAADDSAPVGINGLTSTKPELAADTLLGLFHSLYADSWGPRTHDILHACLLTLARRGDASLVMVPLLLTNPGFRRSVVARLTKADPMGLGSFWSWYEAISDAERQSAIAPLMNKLRPVLLRPGIRAILGQRDPKFDLRDVFTKHRILLVDLSKGTLGPEAAQLLGSMIVSLLWNAALGRATVSASRRTPVMVYIDEVQDYLRLPGDLGDALAQARGLGVGFTLAHQHLGQLPSAIRDAVMANARSRVVFQLGNRDASAIAKTARGALVADDFEQLRAFDAYASLLVDGSPAPWASLRTVPLPPPTQDMSDLLTRSRASYGRPIDEIEADLLSLIESPADDQVGRVHHRRPGDRDD